MKKRALIGQTPIYGLLWRPHGFDLKELSNPALAANLRGKLLLIHSELDENVLPAQTLRLVDALIEADKDVDLLLIPGAEHALLGRMHHVLRRTWDYFLRHLHGTEPLPYRLAPLPPLPVAELVWLSPH
ncbi:MAG: alpha/beta hydrolase family protein [Pseudonocardiaceae bacterium]